jgi:endonuclease/exonuclease/phosphatase family metal-dependent hydrolase
LTILYDLVLGWQVGQQASSFPLRRRSGDSSVSFNPYEPYGAVVSTSVRVATWNVWGRYGRWQERQAGIEDALSVVAPDVVCLVESWSAPEAVQAELIANRLGFEYSLFEGDWIQEDWVSGIGVASRWPVSSQGRHPLHGEDGSGVGEVLFVYLEGDRGPIQLCVVMLDYPLHGSAVRQAQVRQLAILILESTKKRHPVIVCGDFNAGADSDEIRMLTGRSTTAAPDLVFYDAWELAGDGTPGYTWSNRNPLAAVAMYPDRRFDYILSAWPRLGAVGHPLHCELLGVVPAGQPQLSDHYGVLADLRY